MTTYRYCINNSLFKFRLQDTYSGYDYIEELGYPFNETSIQNLFSFCCDELANNKKLPTALKVNVFLLFNHLRKRRFACY